MKRSRLLVITLLASSLMLSACDLSFIDDNTSQVTASLSKIAVSKTPDKVVYEINEQKMNELRFLQFDTPNLEWLRFVVQNRIRHQ